MSLKYEGACLAFAASDKAAAYVRGVACLARVLSWIERRIHNLMWIGFIT